MSNTGFTPEQKDAVMIRDGGMCCLCGAKAEVVNHRINRGQGGRLSMNRLANACALCWLCNDAIEKDGDDADEARALGVKLFDHEDVELVPLWSPFFGMWLILHDRYCTLTGNRDKTRRPDHLLTRVAGVVSP